MSIIKNYLADFKNRVWGNATQKMGINTQKKGIATQNHTKKKIDEIFNVKSKKRGMPHKNGVTPHNNRVLPHKKGG